MSDIITPRTVGEARKLFWRLLDDHSLRERGKLYEQLHHMTKKRLYKEVLRRCTEGGMLPADCDPDRNHYPGLPSFLPRAADFTDMTLIEKPDGVRFASGLLDTLCPLCKGHGGWNLEVNAYGPGKHFRAGCSQCNGWGWVPAADATCVHEWREMSQQECKEKGVLHHGMCWHAYECVRCGKHMATDSSG